MRTQQSEFNPGLLIIIHFQTISVLHSGDKNARTHNFYPVFHI